MKWTKQHRTQAGSWIWFPGKATARSEAIADTMSKGMAVDALASECRLPHQEVKFHERCVEVNKGRVTVYTRAAVEHRHCNEMKYGSVKSKLNKTNMALLELRSAYKSLLEANRVDRRKCSKYRFDDCYTEGYKHHQLGNTALGREYVKISCDEGHMASCSMYGFLSWHLGDFSKAKRYMKYACEEGYTGGCDMLKLFKESTGG